MKSHNISRTKLRGGGSHSHVTLNKLHFDFRNAKPAFFGVSYCKLDDIRTNPDVHQTHLKPSHIECNQGDILRCGVDGKICKTAQPLSTSAVQVDDGDAGQPVDVSDAAAAAQHHTCSVVPTPVRTDRNLTFTSLVTEYLQPTDRSLSDCTVAVEENKILSSDVSSSTLMPSLSEKQSDFCDDEEQCTETYVADNKTDLSALTDSAILKPLSLRVSELRAHDENMEHPLRSTSCNTVESSGTGINLLPTNAPPICLFEDVFDNVQSNVRRSRLRLQSTGKVKKSVRYKNVRSLDTVTAAAGLGDDAKCKESKHKAISRTTKRRQRIKCESEDTVWSARKKLLIMPVDKKCSNTGRRGRKRNTRIIRDIFSPMPKHKRRKSVTVTGMELPDLSTTLDSSVDNADVSDVLYSWVSDVADKTAQSVNVSRKWCIDISGADLTIDLSVDCEQTADSSDQQNCVVPDNPAKQNVSQLNTCYPTDTEPCHTNFSGSQETPPPSVASDGFSSCDESAESVRSNAQEQETHKSPNSQWLSIDTKLARYIDGRHFDRLVNGVSVQVPMTLTPETFAQIGQECLRLEKLTKHDLKELQNQVRLEEIYHRRAKKTVLFPHYSFSEGVQHSERSARLSDSGGVETDAEADAVDQQSASLAVGGLYQSAAESDDDTVFYLSSDDNERVEPKNIIYEPDVTYTSELLSGNVTETSQKTNDSCINDSGTTEHVSAPIHVLIRRRDKNKLQKQNERSEPTPMNVCLPEQTPVPRNCANSDVVAVSDSQVSEASSLQKSTRKTAQNRTGFCQDANEPGADSMHNAVITRRDKSGRDTAGTGKSKYVAATSLSVTTLSTETALSHSEANNDRHKVAEADADVAVLSNCTQGSSPQHLTTQSSISKTVKKATSVKSSKHTDTRNGHRDVKDVERRAAHISIDKHSTKSGGDSVSEVSTSEGQRSGGWRSHSAKASCDEQRVMRSKEKLSVNGDSGSTQFASSSVSKNNTEVATEGQRSQGRRSHSAKASGDDKQSTPNKEKFLSESRINNESGLSCVAAGSVKKATSTSSPHNISENNDCTVSDTARHRSEGRHSIENKDINSCKNKRVTGNNLAQLAASTSSCAGTSSCASTSSCAGTARQTKIESDDSSDVHASLERSDLPTGVENANHVDDTLMSSSSDNCTDTSMLCTSLSKQSSVSSSTAQTSHSLTGLQAVVECSDNETANGEQKILLNSQEVHEVAMTSPLSSTDEGREVQAWGTARHQAAGDEVIKGTVLSDLNSNILLKSSQMSVVTQKQCSDSDVAQVTSVNADTDRPVLSAAVTDAEAVSDSCLLSRANDMNFLAPNSLQLSVISADVITQSPVSPYRELEDIRSPSPALADTEEDDDRAKEIRSPSPCELESHMSMFHVIETSWDVRLTSPCEIQSPDGSDDEADVSVEEFSRHCNVCFHQGPVTIPLTITEASKRTHNQQPDMI